MSDENQTKGFARLEALLEASERSAISRHENLATEVRSLKVSQADLALRVGQIEVRNKLTEGLSAEVSSHMAKDDATNAAIARHIKALEVNSVFTRNTATAIEVCNVDQNLELAKQTKMLQHIRAATPILTAIASAVAAYFAAHH